MALHPPAPDDDPAEETFFPLSCGDLVLGKTRLLAEPCVTCILRPAEQRIAISNDRLREFLGDALASGSFVVCHSTLPSVAPPGVTPAVCRGFADRYDTLTLRLIRALWGFVEVPVPVHGPGTLPEG